MGTETEEKPKRRYQPIAQLDGSDEFKEWVEQFAKHVRLPKQKMLEIALVHYAGSVGFMPLPPRR